MKELTKKKPDEDMLVTHKPAPPKAKVGREAVQPSAAPAAELELLKAKLRSARDAVERAGIVQAIQHGFGNDVAQRVLAELHGAGSSDDITTRPPGGPTPGKGKG